MKKKTTIFFLICLLFNSCKREYKICECTTKDEQLKIYNEILSELIEQHFYNFYLGEDEEYIFKRSADKNTDTSSLNQEIIQHQNRIFGDSSRFCIIYLDTTKTKEFNS